ncbi:MAG: DUF4292 domain-containing protein [Deltaproteobacteria bacterium]|nr:DUF4292 domain-containing protein [Deltaproteobacteria bacterium]
MSSPRRPLELVLVAVLAGTSAGFSCGGVPRPRNAVTDAAEMMRMVGQIRGRARSMRARGKADHFGPEGRVRGTVYFFVEASGRLRFEALTPLDTPAASLASDGTTFTLLDTRERVFYTGPALPCNIARLLRIPMAGRDVAAILLGGTPLIRHDRASLGWDDDGFYVLSLSSTAEGLRQRVEIAPDRSRLDVLKSEVRDSRGIVFAVEFEDFGRIEGVPFPKKIHFVNEREDADVMVHYDRVELNPALPEDAWTLAPPAGMEVRNLGCR